MTPIKLTNLTKTVTRLLPPLAIAAALAFTATPADAQHRGGGGGGGGNGSHASRGGSPSRGAAVSRGSVPQGSIHAAPRVASRGVVVAHPYYSSYSHPYYSHPYYAFRPRFSIGFGIWAGYPVGYPSYYGYPYYGYPGYPYGYSYPAYDPYTYSYPPASSYPAASQPYDYPPPGSSSSGYPPSGYPADGSQGYPAQQPAGSVGVQVGGQQANTGGVSFEITPSTAAVFVDGTYVGTVADFGPSSQPIGLAAGRHHVEVRAQGYQTLPFDVDVTAGEVIPYRGALQPQH